MSPTTLIVVRAMSRIRSTPMIIAMVRGSTFTAASTPINNGKDPPGTPAAPTAVITLRIMTTTCWDNVRGTPKTCARKSTVTPSNSAVPFMHIVDPSGSTKPAILGGIFNSLSATAMLVGSVALLELVERSEEHTSELQSRLHLVCRLLLEKKKKKKIKQRYRHTRHE